MKTERIHIPISDVQTSGSWEEIKSILNNYLDLSLYGHRNNISVITIGGGTINLSGDNLTLSESLILIGVDGVQRYVQSGTYQIKENQFFCVDFKTGAIVLKPVIQSVINNDTLYPLFYRYQNQIISRVTSVMSLGSDDIEFGFDSVSLFDYPENPIPSNAGKISALNMKGPSNKGISFQINKCYSRVMSLFLDLYCENINPADDLSFIIRFYPNSMGGNITTTPSSEHPVTLNGLTQKIERIEFSDLDVGQDISSDDLIYVEIVFVNDPGEYGETNNYHLIRGKGVFK